ncbi:MAG TPA: PEP/pyruvate-binding domain-containing protein [Candidatus Paceibacterota bacterium]|jgi:phosphoenolpyruvate synthase/pyruvate phosphate dikinase
MELTRTFGGLSKNDAPIAGGKGASLGEMTQAGIPVPPGYVILSSAFERFLEEADLIQEVEAILGQVDHNEVHTIERASEEIQGLILNAKMPENIETDVMKLFRELDTEYVAVRSSATAEDGAEHAWAGQLDSYLNTTEEALLKNVQRCWASLFTPRAIFYRFEKGLHTTSISVAVVVQKMVDSEISGIAFSVHPITEDRNQLIIESGFGLGEAIVSGQVTPDSYVVEKQPRKLIDKNISAQTRGIYRAEEGGNEWRDIPEPKASSQVLSDEQILELSELVIRIETHYGFPCDIEWAYEKGSFYITQSRPITTLSSLTNENRRPLYRVNVARDICLATFEVWAESDTKYLNDWIGVTTERLVLERKEGVITAYEDEQIFKDVTERLTYLLKDPEWFNTAIEKYRAGIKRAEELKGVLRESPSKENLRRLFEQLARTQGGLAVVYFVPSVAGIPEEIKERALDERKNTEAFFYSSDEVLSEAIKTLYPDQAEYAQILSIEELTTNLPYVSELQKRLNHFIYYDKKFFYDQGLEVVENELGIQIERPTPTSNTYQKHQRDYTLLGTSVVFSGYCGKVTQDYFSFSPQPMFIYINNGILYHFTSEGDSAGRAKSWVHKYGSAKELDAHKKVHDTLLKDYRAFMAREGHSGRESLPILHKYFTNLLPLILVAIEVPEHEAAIDKEIIDACFKIRSENEDVYKVGFDFQKKLLNQLETEDGLAENVLSLTTVNEFDRYLSTGALPTDLVNRNAFALIEHGTGGIIVHKDESKLTELDRQATVTDTSELKGNTAYGGRATGRVRIIKLVKDMDQLQEGEVLVASMTDPRYVPAMKKAAAIVTDEGGVTSHAAIVARELKKPCIIGTKVATQVLRNGDDVDVDADSGVIRIVKRAPLFKKEDYVLSFWAQGVSIFVTDIHFDAYKHLGILFIIEDGKFKQYFLKEKYEEALDEGVKFYSQEHAVLEYKEALEAHCNNLAQFFETQIKGKEHLAQNQVREFFEYTKKLVGDYTKMNFEYTDKAYTKKDQDTVIESNLALITKFKDEVRAVMNKTLFESDGYVAEIWKILAKQFDVAPAMLDNLTQEEILALFSGSKPAADVADRRHAFVYSYANRMPIDGEEAVSIVKEFEENVDAAMELRGQTANKGKVRGRVKVIAVDYSDFGKLNREIERMKEGEVLVAETTAPELLMACKKAGAIITDMGGLMSHAAIVSREFGIPCIVGTKNASQVLKDGDLVEVDADTGVVTRIETSRS